MEMQKQEDILRFVGERNILKFRCEYCIYELTKPFKGCLAKKMNIEPEVIQVIEELIEKGIIAEYSSNCCKYFHPNHKFFNEIKCQT